MNETIEFQGKPLTIETTRRAQQALADRTVPLLAEMQLYFSCMIVKQVYFHDEDDSANSTRVNNALAIRFRPVMRETCSFDKILETPKSDLAIAHAENFVPKWLKIDFTDKGWSGQFGY